MIVAATLGGIRVPPNIPSRLRAGGSHKYPEPSENDKRALLIFQQCCKAHPYCPERREKACITYWGWLNDRPERLRDVTEEQIVRKLERIRKRR